MILTFNSMTTPAGHGNFIGQHIVNGRAKQHSGFPSGIFSQVPPNGTGPGRGGIRGKDKAATFCSIHGILGDDPGFNFHAGVRLTQGVCCMYNF